MPTSIRQPTRTPPHLQRHGDLAPRTLKSIQRSLPVTALVCTITDHLLTCHTQVESLAHRLPHHVTPDPYQWPIPPVSTRVRLHHHDQKAVAYQRVSAIMRPARDFPLFCSQVCQLPRPLRPVFGSSVRLKTRKEKETHVELGCQKTSSRVNRPKRPYQSAEGHRQPCTGP
ncbi:hypothetical protein EDD17DRAFT_1562819 [Pisolithus thermaeus]|nr:hypothetical protein EDD17DRAFT_1562819 [Pisolithus thermaeus]